MQPELQGRIVLDLAGVEFIDDSGLGFIVGTARRLLSSGGSLVLRDARPEIRRTLENIGLDRIEGLSIESG